MSQIKPNILLIGCGPHARRVYVPALKGTEKNFGTDVKAIVELKEKESDTSGFIGTYYPNAYGIYVEPFAKSHRHTLPPYLEQQLNSIVKSGGINGVVIATDPLNHMQYALWAQKLGLHVLMDKPISTYENVANSTMQARQLMVDFYQLMENHRNNRCFVINTQRRFMPQFDVIEGKINEVAARYGMPVTTMQSTHSDGQWRLPNEILTQTYHPYLGWGKVSHSGYHMIDLAGKLTKESYACAGKKFDEISVFSRFIRPSGLLKQQSQQDLVNLFGKDYQKLSPKTDEELTQLYKVNNEAEVDAAALVSLSSDGVLMTNITLNLLHNGFCRRDWMMPNTDLYKGNGRVRHEYHNIQQGPLQNIQAHSYQSNDKHDVNTEDDFALGGNNHYDIHIYKNSNLIGGTPLEIITAKDLALSHSLDTTKVMNELARHKAVHDFIEVITGQRKTAALKANLPDHGLSVQLMSMVYESGIKGKEVRQPFQGNPKGEEHGKSQKV